MSAELDRRRKDMSAARVAEIFGCTPRKVREEAAKCGAGMNLKGRAGWRFTDADVTKLRKAMAPEPPVQQRRSA